MNFFPAQNSKITHIKIKFKRGSQFIVYKIIKIQNIKNFIINGTEKITSKLPINYGKRLIELKSEKNRENGNVILKSSDFVPFIFVIPKIILITPKVVGYSILVYKWFYFNRKISSLSNQELKQMKLELYSFAIGDNNYILRKHLLSIALLISVAIEIISLLSVHYREQFAIAMKWHILIIRMVPGWCYILSELLEKKKIKSFFGILLIFTLMTLYPLSASDILNRPVQSMPYTVYLEKVRELPSKKLENKPKTPVKFLKKLNEQKINQNLNSNSLKKNEKNVIKRDSQKEQEILEELTPMPNKKFENKIE